MTTAVFEPLSLYDTGPPSQKSPRLFHDVNLSSGTAENRPVCFGIKRMNLTKRSTSSSLMFLTYKMADANTLTPLSTAALTSKVRVPVSPFTMDVLNCTDRAGYITICLSLKTVGTLTGSVCTVCGHSHCPQCPPTQPLTDPHCCSWAWVSTSSHHCTVTKIEKREMTNQYQFIIYEIYLEEQMFE